MEAWMTDDAKARRGVKRKTTVTILTLGYLTFMCFSSEVLTLPGLDKNQSQNCGAIVQIVVEVLIVALIGGSWCRHYRKKRKLKPLKDLATRFPFYLAYNLCLPMLLYERSDTGMWKISEDRKQYFTVLAVLNIAWGFTMILYISVDIPDTSSMSHLCIFSYGIFKLLRYSSHALLEPTILGKLIHRLSEREEFVMRFIAGFTADFYLKIVDTLLYNTGSTSKPIRSTSFKPAVEEAAGIAKDCRIMAEIPQDKAPLQEESSAYADVRSKTRTKGSKEGIVSDGRSTSSHLASPSNKNNATMGHRKSNEAGGLRQNRSNEFTTRDTDAASGLRHRIPIGAVLLFPSIIFLLHAIQIVPKGKCSVSYFIGALFGGTLTLICGGKLLCSLYLRKRDPHLAEEVQLVHPSDRHWHSLGVSRFALLLTGSINILQDILLIIDNRRRGCTLGVAFLSVGCLSGVTILIYVHVVRISRMVWSRWLSLAVALLELLWLIAECIVQGSEIAVIGHGWLARAASAGMPLTVVFRLYCCLIFHRYYCGNGEEIIPDGRLLR